MTYTIYIHTYIIYIGTSSIPMYNRYIIYYYTVHLRHLQQPTGNRYTMCEYGEVFSSRRMEVTLKIISITYT